MSDEDDRSGLKISREQLLAMLGVGANPAANDTTQAEETNTHKQIRVPFTVAEHIYVIHDGTRYEVVETDDGLTIVEGDE